MANLLKMVLEIIKAFSRIPLKNILASVCLTSALLLFAPQKILCLLIVQGFRKEHASIIGLAFIVSSTTLFVFFIVWIWRYIQRSLQYSGRDARRRLDAMSDWSKSLILQMYENPTHAQKLPLQNANVKAMLNSNIILQAELGNMSGFDCVLQPWVVKYLDTHPNFVGRIKKFEKPFIVHESPYAFSAGY